MDPSLSGTVASRRGFLALERWTCQMGGNNAIFRANKARDGRADVKDVKRRKRNDARARSLGAETTHGAVGRRRCPRRRLLAWRKPSYQMVFIRDRWGSASMAARLFLKDAQTSQLILCATSAYHGECWEKEGKGSEVVTHSSSSWLDKICIVD